MIPRRTLLFFSAIPAVSGFVPSGTKPRAFAAQPLQASALIIQNKGGGHGELGYQLAKVLESQYSDKIDSITLLQDDACEDTQEPFQSYASDLPNVKVIKAPLGDDSFDATAMQALLGTDARFDFVFDNASKKPEGSGKACADCAKDWGVELYVYVSSAGMYQPGADGPFPMPETTPVKSSAGQAQFDNYCVEQGLPLVSFRPQYIYGEKANKFDYIDYFFDRLVRNLPVPIPGDGTQLVSLTNSEDVASLLAAPLSNPSAAIEQRYFNCGTDKLISYDDVVHLCAKVAEKTEYHIEHYNAAMFENTKFPFRDSNFYISPDTAKAKLGWQGPLHSLEADLPAYFEHYKARGGPTKYIFFMKDWEIVVGHKTPPDMNYVGSVYDDYDPLVIEEMEPN